MKKPPFTGSLRRIAGIIPGMLLCCFIVSAHSPQSKYIQLGKDGSLKYLPDEKGNIIPDFSKVGYHHGNEAIPDVPVIITVSPTQGPDAGKQIQAAIDQLSATKPGANGIRGAILIQKGVYLLSAPITLKASGIVLRGEGDHPEGTKLVATWKNEKALIQVSGDGNAREVAGSRTSITDNYVPTGATSFHVKSSRGFVKGDRIILYQLANAQWVSDLKMDQMEDRGGTKQWKPGEYNLSFERSITAVEGNKITIDNPVMQPIDAQYGGAEIYKYSFGGRIFEVGIEQIYCETQFESDTSENHSWDAISINTAENGWVRNVTARYFSYGCVNLGGQAKNFTVQDSKCFDHKSKITGGRRYSFNNTGQQNLFIRCATEDGRHDYVTGARVCGPNVFTQSTSKRTHADIGPHHRWAVGTLYDRIDTDGDINVQDRGNWGSGHGWAGVTQVIWNCSVRKAAIQNPWVAGKNYCIGLKGTKYQGRLPGRPDGEWEGLNQSALPASLYEAQLAARKRKAIQ